MKWPVQRSLTHGRALWDGLVVCFPFWPGGDVEAIGPKKDLFPTNTLAGGAVWDGNGVDTSSTTAGTAIELGTADPIPEGNFSLLFAGRLDALPVAGDFAQFIAKRDTFAVGDMRWQWFIAPADSSPANEIRFTQNTSNINFGVSGKTGDHVWVLTDDNTNMRLYEDGLLVSTQGSHTFGTDAAAGLRIGNSETAGTEQVDGVVDVVAMWDRPLTAAEVSFMGAFPYALFDPRGGKLGIVRRG